MKKEITAEIHKRLDSPFQELMSAIERYEEQPSIPNGARKQEARESLNKAIRETAEFALEKWQLSTDDFNDIVDEMYWPL